MRYPESTFIIYTSKKGEVVYTKINKVNEEEGFYTLDFDETEAIERQVELYLLPNLSVPDGMTDQNIIDYHINAMPARIVDILNESNSYRNLKITHDMQGVIYFETAIENAKVLEDETEYEKIADKLEKLIDEIKERVRSDFGKTIEVRLKFPYTTRPLKSITF